MRYGTVVPFDDGWLPVYSVDTDEEAEELLREACPLNRNGEFVAPELAAEQTLDNLFAFGERLEKIHKRLTKKKANAENV